MLIISPEEDSFVQIVRAWKRPIYWDSGRKEMQKMYKLWVWCNNKTVKYHTCNAMYSRKADPPEIYEIFGVSGLNGATYRMEANISSETLKNRNIWRRETRKFNSKRKNNIQLGRAYGEQAASIRRAIQKSSETRRRVARGTRTVEISERIFLRTARRRSWFVLGGKQKARFDVYNRI